MGVEKVNKEALGITYVGIKTINQKLLVMPKNGESLTEIVFVDVSNAH